MKQYLLVITLLFCLCLILNAQQYLDPQDKVAIKEAALNYAEGYYSGDGERMEKAIHPDLDKVSAIKLPQTGKFFLSYSTVSGLIEMTRAKVGLLEQDKRKIEISILLADEKIACVKLKSAKFNDYLQMAKFEGKWKIINVLWTLGVDVPNQPERKDFDTASEKKKIRIAVNDYYIGLYSHDIESIERTIHPEFNFVKFKKLPQTGKFVISRYRQSFIKEIVRAKLQKISEEKKKVEIIIMDVMDGMAFVEAVSSFSNSYYQLQLFDDSWKIVNVFSKPL